MHEPIARARERLDHVRLGLHVATERLLCQCHLRERLTRRSRRVRALEDGQRLLVAAVLPKRDAVLEQFGSGLRARDGRSRQRGHEQEHQDD